VRFINPQAGFNYAEVTRSLASEQLFRPLSVQERR